MGKITYKINGTEISLDCNRLQEPSIFMMLQNKELSIPNIDVEDFYKRFPVGISISEKLQEMMNYVNARESIVDFRTAFKLNTLLLPLIQELFYNDSIFSILDKVFTTYDPNSLIKQQIYSSVTEDMVGKETDFNSAKFVELLNKVLASLLVSSYYFLDFDYTFFTDFIKGSTNSLIPFVYGE